MSNKSQVYESMYLYNTPESSYVLGLTHAEATITQNSLSIEINSKDGKSIESILESCGRWLKYHRQRENWQPTTDYRLNSRELIIHLDNVFNIRSSELSIKTNEVLSIHSPNLFIRGLFDGDGNWYYHPKNYIRNFNISAPYDFEWDSFIPLIPKVRYNISYKTSKKGYKSSAFRISNKADIIKLYDFVYEGYDEIGMPRKRNQANILYQSCL